MARTLQGVRSIRTTMTTRTELKVSQEKETKLILELGGRLLSKGINASNTVIITVSGDYSSIVGQMLRHLLSYEGEICDGFSVDVPYPDEEWDFKYQWDLNFMLNIHKDILIDKNILLVEAGVIRGGNYTFVVSYLRDTLGFAQRIHTLALYENVGSKFKSDFVGEYYDDKTQDLTFWWEMDNKHWNLLPPTTKQ